jgi:exopolysaccharide production protein ExoQ
MSSSIDHLENEPGSQLPTSGLPFAVGFYFSCRIMIVLVSVRLFGVDPRNGTAINIGLDCLFLLVTAFCSIGQVRYPFGEMTKLASVRWALLFVAFSCCSFLWSSSASLPESVVYWCAMAADVAIVVLLLRVGPLTSVSGSLMKGYVWGACAVAFMAWVMPTQADLRLGDDELLGANSIGYVCAFAFFFAQYLIREKRGQLGVPAFVLAVTLLRTISKTTILAFIVGQGFLLMRDKSISRRSKLLIAFATAAVVAIFWSLLVSYFYNYTDTSVGNQSETLTGRLGIWAYFLSEAIQQPWIGHGFDSAWKVIPPFGEFEAPHAHNELLQQFYAYGVVGVCLFAGIYWSLYRQIHRLMRGPRKTFFLAFLMFILVRGTADTERFDLSFPLWAIVMISLLIEQARKTNDHTVAASPIKQFEWTSSASSSQVIPTDL